ncbi:MAG: phosphoribosylformylglycinamidine synthase I, partial [Candidatus Woykebacteria bacterium RBG_13_40_7b]
TDGTNCDEETFYAFEKFGGYPEYVHVNFLRQGKKKLKDYQILVLPGGFSYGDDVASGKILAVEMTSFFKDKLTDFVKGGGLVLGICNGFQTLVRTGLLPYGAIGKMEATLAQNASGHFECRWVDMRVEKSRCEFLNGHERKVAEVSVNHGEGRFFAESAVIKKIQSEGLVVFRYVDEKGRPTQEYPLNPNGSVGSIAGICDPTGRVLGLMPHPEKFIDTTQHPNWRRFKYNSTQPNFIDGGFIFEQMIKFVKHG